MLRRAIGATRRRAPRRNRRLSETARRRRARINRRRRLREGEAKAMASLLKLSTPLRKPLISPSGNKDFLEKSIHFESKTGAGEISAAVLEA